MIDSRSKPKLTRSSCQDPLPTAVFIWFRILSLSILMPFDSYRIFKAILKEHRHIAAWFMVEPVHEGEGRGDRFVSSLDGVGSGPVLYRGIHHVGASSPIRPHFLFSHILSLVIPQHKTSIYDRHLFWSQPACRSSSGRFGERY